MHPCIEHYRSNFTYGAAKQDKNNWCKKILLQMPKAEPREIIQLRQGLLTEYI